MKQPRPLTAVVVGMGTLGPPTATKLVQAGVRTLVITNRNIEKAERSAEALGAELGDVNIIPLAVDVCDRTSIYEFLSRLDDAVPEDIDVVVVTSGGNSPDAIFNKRDTPESDAPDAPLSMEARWEFIKKYQRWSPEAMERMYAANVQGPVHLLYRLLPRLIVQERPPVIFTIGSVSPQLSGVNHYASAKCALREETKRLAQHLAADRRACGLIPGRAICLIWGFTLSEQSRGLLEGADGKPTYRGSGILSALPLHELNQAEEFADALLAIALNPAFNVEVRADGGFGSAVVV